MSVHTYDPNVPLLRQMLALSLLDKLDECGFKEVELSLCPNQSYDENFCEKVYTRNITKDGKLKVKVFTTVTGGKPGYPLEVRENGRDAIRVCATYTTKAGKERGLIKETRVNRVGDIDNIVTRMHERMRMAWKAATADGARCHNCGAPKFVTKQGKHVCAEICWLSDKEKRASEIAYKSQSRRRRRRR